VKSYSNYLDHIAKSSTDIQIQEYKRSPRYNDFKMATTAFKSKFSAFGRGPFTKRVILKFSAGKANDLLDSKYYFSFFINTLAQIIGIEFEEDKIPLRIFYYNRAFHNIKFSYTIGDLHDCVPFLVDIKAATYKSCDENFYEIIKMQSEQGINSLAIQYADDEVRKEEYGSPLNFNFLGMFDSEQEKANLQSLKNTPFKPYRTLAYYNEKNELVLILLNGIKTEKEKDVLAYLSTLTEFLGLEYVTVQNENE
jgi:hypothetical protein